MHVVIELYSRTCTQSLLTCTDLNPGPMVCSLVVTSSLHSCNKLHSRFYIPLSSIRAQLLHSPSYRAPVLNRSIDETRDLAERAFESVTSDECKNMIGHAQKCIDKFIKSDAGGVLQQCGSLSVLLSLSEEELSMLEMPDA